jgi:Tfp pilus assembly protein PilX
MTRRNVEAIAGAVLVLVLLALVVLTWPARRA